MWPDTGSSGDPTPVGQQLPLLNNKTWIFEEVINDNPDYFTRNKHSKKYLEVPDGTFSNGKQVAQGWYHGGNKQQWKIQMQSDGRISSFQC